MRHPGWHWPPVPPSRIPSVYRQVPVSKSRWQGAPHSWKGSTATGTTAAGALVFSASSPYGFATPTVQRTKRGILYGWLVIGRESELYQAKVVLEDLGIALDRRLPVLVDTALEHRLGIGDLVGVRWSVVMVESVGLYLVEMCRVCILAALSE